MDALNELSDSFESLEGAVINGTFKFDKESKMLKTFSLNIDTSNATNIENVKINEFSVTLDFVGINNNISVSFMLCCCNTCMSSLTDGDMVSSA